MLEYISSKSTQVLPAVRSCPAVVQLKDIPASRRKYKGEESVLSHRSVFVSASKLLVIRPPGVKDLRTRGAGPLPLTSSRRCFPGSEGGSRSMCCQLARPASQGRFSETVRRSCSSSRPTRCCCFTTAGKTHFSSVCQTSGPRYPKASGRQRDGDRLSLSRLLHKVLTFQHPMICLFHIEALCGCFNTFYQLGAFLFTNVCFWQTKEQTTINITNITDMTSNQDPLRELTVPCGDTLEPSLMLSVYLKTVLHESTC